MKPILAIIMTVGACQTTTTPTPDTRCSRENCVAMAQCRVGLAVEPYTRACNAVGGLAPAGFDHFASCVDVCERIDAGALVGCIAEFGAACENATTAQRDAYVTTCTPSLSASAQTCRDACFSEQKSCSLMCPVDSFATCNACIVQCSDAAVDCFNNCGS
jgi:hypothetical protein